MSRLLRASFRRLWKNKLFWGCMIFMALNALDTVISQYVSFIKYGGEKETYFYQSQPLGQTVAVSVIAAIFIGLFIGTEYSCGTMRNQLCIGHKRTAIYFSNLAVCIAAAVMMHVVYAAVTVIGGFIAFGNFITDPGTLAEFFAVSLIVVTAFAAILLPISMLVSSKSAGVAATIMTSFVMLMAAMVINSGLNEPMMYEGYTLIDSSGQQITEPETENPFYVTGTKRKVYEALYDILPSCQAWRVQMDDMPENPAVIPLWSAAVIAAATACGTAGFVRKDLK